MFFLFSPLGAIGTSIETVFGSRVRFTCPEGQVFATGVEVIDTVCMPGGKWSQSYIPKCQEVRKKYSFQVMPVPIFLQLYCITLFFLTHLRICFQVYCGPVPQIDNGFAVAATNVSFRGMASYQCYAGFGFASGNPIETIVCNSEGSWSFTPECQASQCPPLPDVDNAEAQVLAGRGLNYGTVVRYECSPGYQRTGLPVLLCQSDGSWSSDVPSCSRKQCHDFPDIENGYVIDEDRKYFYGDEALVECHRGYSRLGSNIITCGEDQEFTDVPKCMDKNECDAFQCDFKSTECENLPGSYHCKCREGFEPNLECRPVSDLGLSDDGIPNESIMVSGSEEGYPKELLRLNSPLGWCGSSNIIDTTNPGNWVTIDLRAPSVIRGFRTQGVRRADGQLAFPTAIRLLYTNDLSDKMRPFKNTDDTPIEFRVLDGSSMSVMNLPIPIEARYLRLN